MSLNEWKSAEIDARTLFDVLEARANSPDATSDDVRLKNIAMRNWKFVSDIYPTPE